MAGRVYPVVLIEPANMLKRVEELRVEALNRGYNYNAKYEQPDISYLPDDIRFAKVDLEVSRVELSRRCPECKKLIEEYYERRIGE